MSNNPIAEASDPIPSDARRRQTEAPGHPSRHMTARLLRSAGCMFFASPVAFAVLVTCMWVLGHILALAVVSSREQLPWSTADVVRLIGINVAVIFLACLAIGYLALLWRMGWKEIARRNP